MAKLGFESPVRLKPRQHLSSSGGGSIGASSSLSYHSYSHSHGQGRQYAQSLSHSHGGGGNNNNNNDDDDNDDENDDRSLTSTVMRMWRKQRKTQKRRSKSSSSRYHKTQKPENHIQFLMLAKVIVMLYFFWCIIQFFQQSQSEFEVQTTATATATTTATLPLIQEGDLLLDSGGGDANLNTKVNKNKNINDVLTKQIMPENVRTILKHKLKKGNLRDKLKKIQEAEVNVSRLASKSSRIRPHNPSIVIPNNIDSFYRDITVTAPSSPQSLLSSGDVPVFWHILKSGGTTIKDMFGQCMAKVEASEAGVLNGHINDATIQTVTFPHSGIQYVNVDTSTAPGIERAIRMNLIQSGMADMIFTPLLHESSQLFNHTTSISITQTQLGGLQEKGQIFALFRHPVERAVSLFHYLKKATWEPTFSERLKKIKNVEDYAISEFAEDNWMVRFLTNKMTEMLTRDDLDVAKEILRRKVIVGLVIDVRGAIQRFLTYLRWNYNDLTLEQQQCMNRYLSSGSNKNVHEIVEEGTMGWRILKANNLLDLELYDYVLQLYEEQGKLLGIN